MRLILLACWLATACGTPAPVITAPPPRPVAAPFVAPPVTLPAALQPVTARTVCSRVAAPGMWPAQSGKIREYDFSPLPLALAFGPTATQPTAGFQRDGDSIRVAIIRQTDRLAACMRAAIGTKPPMRRQFGMNRGDYVTIQLALTIDPFGLAHDIVVDAPPQLVDCVRDTLGAIRVNRRTPRETRATVDLSFTNLQATTPAKPPPPVVPVEPRPGCMIARDPLPIDTVALAGLDVDFDPPAERGRRARCDRGDVDKAAIRDMVRANLGNLRACYLAAAQRSPGLAGALTTRFVLGPWGQPTQIRVDGAGDAAFHDCVTAQLELMATDRIPETPVEAVLPFALDGAATHSWPAATTAIEAGDLDGAAAMFARDAKAAHDADLACRARVGIVQAYANPPGGPDARSDAAIAELARFVATQQRAALSGCLEQARPILEAIARWPVRPKRDVAPWRGGGLAEAIVRAAKLRAMFPELDHEALSFMARGLTALRKTDDALALYLQYFALGDRDPDRVKVTAEGYAAAARLRDDGVPWDTCEERARY